MVALLTHSKMNISDCGKDPTDEEIEILVKSLMPGQKLPLLYDFADQNYYYEQLVEENYSDRLLEDYELEFITKRIITKRALLNDKQKAVLHMFWYRSRNWSPRSRS